MARTKTTQAGEAAPKERPAAADISVRVSREFGRVLALIARAEGESIPRASDRLLLPHAKRVLAERLKDHTADH